MMFNKTGLDESTNTWSQHPLRSGESFRQKKVLVPLASSSVHFYSLKCELSSEHFSVKSSLYLMVGVGVYLHFRRYWLERVGSV